LRGLISELGIGPTTASALAASLSGRHDFKNGPQLAALVGLVPGLYSSGGKARLGRITKAGNAYLRSLLVIGAFPTGSRNRFCNQLLTMTTREFQRRRLLHISRHTTAKSLVEEKPPTWAAWMTDLPSISRR
jgi:transposase